MGNFSTNMVGVATRLLAKFGQPMTFNRSIAGAFDPMTNTTAADMDSTYTGFVHPEDYTRFERDLESVRQDDIKLLVNQTTDDPLIGDTFTLDTVSYSIVDIEKVKAQGETIIYIIQGRI